MTKDTTGSDENKTDSGLVLVERVPQGMEGWVLSDLLASHPTKQLIFVARNDSELATTEQVFRFCQPDAERIVLPAWDCLPYDRVSPNAEVLGKRLRSLVRLLRPAKGPRVLFTTVNALLQRLPSREALGQSSFRIVAGESLDEEALNRYLVNNGYARVGTVNDPGEYAVRGGLIDVFPMGSPNPVRIDLFGDEVEKLRRFDALSQRTIKEIASISLLPVSEVMLSPDAIARFRSGYRATFGSVSDADPLYTSISEGRRFPGMEHWLPLFYDQLDTVLDYMPGAGLVLEHQCQEVRGTRMENVRDFYEARRSMLEAEAQGESLYKPLPPEQLYMSDGEWEGLALNRAVWQLSPFAAPDSPGLVQISAQGQPGLNFESQRKDPDVDLYRAFRDHMRSLQGEGRRVVLAGLSEGSKTRLASLLGENDILIRQSVASLADIKAMPKKSLGLAVLPIERGFVSPDIAIISEQDLLGEKIARAGRRKKRAENFLSEVSALSTGDLVVHLEHGIGQYLGLETIEIGGAPHDVLQLKYSGDDKLYIPVENIEILSRFGGEDAGVALDKLGGAAWQLRRAKVKKRLKDIAAQLIKIAAQRMMKKAVVLEQPEPLYNEFAARFPYTETEDQLVAIDDAIEDLQSGRPMDRLVCGDVGFGKTEVAIRAAFVAAMSGAQVALVCPTTLLARQHYNNFKQRFEGWPIRVHQLSRLVMGKEASLVKEELAAGKADVVIGTHALLAQSIKFKQLGLLIVDEEQKFGVKQKERLKELKSDVHVLTLSATPIPRTLSMAMSGVKELSLITTPPVDRLAVRTFVSPWDSMIVREALMREHFRGGQSFVVCPQVRDIEKMLERLEKIAPELKVRSATGQIAASELEQTMNDFYDHKFDVLLATNIVEAGLDIPNVNTLIVHRADRFGLASLYQLRGRVGRGKQRGYAYLTYATDRPLTAQATKRLEVLQTLDNLGAGFQLASHDMDIRGAGNLVGEEQSGHIKEVGVELYQQMLEEAVTQVNSKAETESEENWSPQINLGTAVLIPDNYVEDLNVRMSLYRRLSDLANAKELESFASELIDRFGSLPDEVENLMSVMSIKLMCKRAGIEKLDVGPKGIVLQFRNNKFNNPDKLLQWVEKNKKLITVRSDMRLVYKRRLDSEQERVKSVKMLVKNMAALAA